MLDEVQSINVLIAVADIAQKSGTMTLEESATTFAAIQTMKQRLAQLADQKAFQEANQNLQPIDEKEVPAEKTPRKTGKANGKVKPEVAAELSVTKD